MVGRQQEAWGSVKFREIPLTALISILNYVIISILWCAGESLRGGGSTATAQSPMETTRRARDTCTRGTSGEDTAPRHVTPDITCQTCRYLLLLVINIYKLISRSLTTFIKKVFRLNNHTASSVHCNDTCVYNHDRYLKCLHDLK